MPDARTRRRRA